jgi:hypothetical protein
VGQPEGHFEVLNNLMLVRNVDSVFALVVVEGLLMMHFVVVHRMIELLAMLVVLYRNETATILLNLATLAFADVLDLELTGVP